MSGTDPHGGSVYGPEEIYPPGGAWQGSWVGCLLVWAGPSVYLISRMMDDRPGLLERLWILQMAAGV